jgi:hypothetical protein
MTEAAAPAEHHSRLIRAWHVLTGRDEATPRARDDSVSFAELVWAHHKRQEALEHQSEPAAEDVYRRRLLRFKTEHGTVLETYWCRYVASGVALTEVRGRRRIRNFLRRDTLLRFHTATDWRTEHANQIESALHRWETLAIRIGEILRGPSERIALYRVFGGTTRLLAFADRKDAPSAATDPELPALLRDDEAELKAVRAFYIQAGENSARIVYFHGMIEGALALAVVIGGTFLVAWQAHWINPDLAQTKTLFVTVGMGAAGAILSVMTRMKRRDGWGLEWEVGRKSVRFLGSIRPWIGAMFAFALYLALKGQLVDLLPAIDPNKKGQIQEKALYFYATVAFFAGFSERWAQVLLGNVGGKAGDDEEEDGNHTRRGRSASHR